MSKDSDQEHVEEGWEDDAEQSVAFDDVGDDAEGDGDGGGECGGSEADVFEAVDDEHADESGCEHFVEALEEGAVGVFVEQVGEDEGECANKDGYGGSDEADVEFSLCHVGPPECWVVFGQFDFQGQTGRVAGWIVKTDWRVQAGVLSRGVAG